MHMKQNENIKVNIELSARIGILNLSIIFEFAMLFLEYKT